MALSKLAWSTLLGYAVKCVWYIKFTCSYVVMMIHDELMIQDDHAHVGKWPPFVVIEHVSLYLQCLLNVQLNICIAKWLLKAIMLHCQDSLP